MRKALRFPRGLYGVTPEWDDTRRLVSAVREATAGGMRALQLRRKTAIDSSRAVQARELAAVCRDLSVVFIINDHWQLALDVGADGVHVGRDDANVADIQAQAGPDFLIGASCYNDLNRAKTLLERNVDYIAFGAVFPSQTKPDAVHAPLSVITKACQLAESRDVPCPAVVAIGGITPNNAAQVVDSGADSIAVITGLFDAHGIRGAAQRYAAAFTVQPYQHYFGHHAS